MTRSTAFETTATIRSIDDLYALKHATGLTTVHLESARFKFSGLLRHAIKYGLWSLKTGGTLTIADNGPSTLKLAPYTVPFQVVCQQAVKLLSDEAELVAIDPAKMTITFRRTSCDPLDHWTAGIIISGAASEKPFLDNALAGLRAQRQFQTDEGQIIICGPAAGRSLIDDDRIEYIDYEGAGPRALTAHKKNLILAQARNPKIAILHARMVLTDKCLDRMPANFDAMTPCSEYHHAGGVVPHDDLIFIDVLDLESVTRKLPSHSGYNRARYLSQFTRGRPFISGGIFLVSKKIATAVPLSDHLAWGEAEDMEWCARLHAHGAIVDLEPGAVVLTQSYRHPAVALKSWRAYLVIRTLTRTARYILNAARYHLHLFAR